MAIRLLCVCGIVESLQERQSMLEYLGVCRVVLYHRRVVDAVIVQHLGRPIMGANPLDQFGSDIDPIAHE
jgi:hypothetical protein